VEDGEAGCCLTTRWQSAWKIGRRANTPAERRTADAMGLGLSSGLRDLPARGSPVDTEHQGCLGNDGQEKVDGCLVAAEIDDVITEIQRRIGFSDAF